MLTTVVAFMSVQTFQLIKILPVIVMLHGATACSTLNQHNTSNIEATLATSQSMLATAESQSADAPQNITTAVGFHIERSKDYIKVAKQAQQHSKNKRAGQFSRLAVSEAERAVVLSGYRDEK